MFYSSNQSSIFLLGSNHFIRWPARYCKTRLDVFVCYTRKKFLNRCCVTRDRTVTVVTFTCLYYNLDPPNNKFTVLCYGKFLDIRDINISIHTTFTSKNLNVILRFSYQRGSIYLWLVGAKILKTEGSDYGSKSASCRMSSL